MDDLTDDWPLTAGGGTTFELIDRYLLVLMQINLRWKNVDFNQFKQEGLAVASIARDDPSPACTTTTMHFGHRQTDRETDGHYITSRAKNCLVMLGLLFRGGVYQGGG